MKVFLPFCEEALAEGRGLSGADLVPYQLDYPVLRTLRSEADAPLPRLGEAQVIVPEDWPQRPAADADARAEEGEAAA